jgi:hypothetical protein
MREAHAPICFAAAADAADYFIFTAIAGHYAASA